MTITPDLTLSGLVSEEPGRAHVLEAFGLNYCCGGEHTLHEACQAAQVDEAAVVKALVEVPSERGAHWDDLSLEHLGDVIVDTHHTYLWRELPRLTVLIGKVTRAHGWSHPELHVLGETFDQLCATLEAHLREEAGVLYPAIAAREAGIQPEGRQRPVSEYLDEHQKVGELVARLRELSDEYAPPRDGCTSYRAMMAGLSDLDHAIRVHVHLENTELFPRAQRLGII